MTQGNSPTYRVHFFEWDMEVLDRHDGLRGESFVDFVEIDIVDRDSCLLEDFGDGEGGADTGMLALGVVQGMP